MCPIRPRHRYADDDPGQADPDGGMILSDAREQRETDQAME